MRIYLILWKTFNRPHFAARQALSLRRSAQSAPIKAIVREAARALLVC